MPAPGPREGGSRRCLQSSWCSQPLTSLGGGGVDWGATRPLGGKSELPASRARPRDPTAKWEGRARHLKGPVLVGRHPGGSNQSTNLQGKPAKPSGKFAIGTCNLTIQRGGCTVQVAVRTWTPPLGTPAICVGDVCKQRHGPGSGGRWWFGWSLVVGVVVLALCGLMPLAFPRAAYADFLYTRSHYIDRTNKTDWYDTGKGFVGEIENGTRPNNSFVVLDLGGQELQGSTWGTVLHNQQWLSNADGRTDIVEEYIKGFISGAHRPDFATIVLGTNNSVSVGSTEGLNWAQNVAIVDEWVHDNGYQTYIGVWGGADLENGEGYAAQNPSEDWATSFSANTSIPYIDYGDAGGCPSTGTPPGPPGWACTAYYTWYTGALWTMSYGSPYSWPFPEDYDTNCVMADQWQKISYYAYLYKGGKLDFQGVAAATIGNTPQEAWSCLNAALNTNDYPYTVGSVPNTTQFVTGP